jgi:hypothetical protein
VATWNQFRVGGKVDKESGKLPNVHDVVVEEGAEGEGDDGGVSVREGKGIPGTVAERRSHFQNEAKRKEWEFEVGRVYWADFGNQYLDFNGTCLSFFLIVFVYISVVWVCSLTMLYRIHTSSSWVQYQCVELYK